MSTQSTELPQALIDPVAERALGMRLQGELLRPGESGYDAARTVWNAMVDRRPGLIARCANAQDVALAVTFAREHQLPLAIKGGGHNVAGRAVCDGGLMIELSFMKSVDLDATRRVARAGAGLLWEEFDRETQVAGLATTGGLVGSTGIAGLTLGGGQGWLTGKYGLSLDNLTAVEMVTAEGQIVRASADEHSDLFWAMRGAGTNFGVATAFEYRLHPVSTVLGGLVIHPISEVRDVLRFYRDFAVQQPDELTTYAAVLTLPDGAPAVAFVACYTGDLQEGERVLAPLRAFGSPLVDTVAQIPYLEMQAIIGPGFPHGRLNYWKSGLTRVIADETIEAIAEFGQRLPSPYTAIVIADCHGAYSRVAATETAYAPRDMQFDLVILSSWVDQSATEANIQWTRDLFTAVEPHLGGSLYVNDLDIDDGADQVRRAYGVNYSRLVQLKQRYDPDNLFRLNTNIPPA